ncbi:MAG TPA: DMT family transporter [Noviherbaspirillum sp.]|nr:DMT family transporter [Noviherbaspirillum sp.]
MEEPSLSVAGRRTALRGEDNLRSIAFMLAAVAMFALMDTVMKLLAQHYPAMQVAALRGLAALPLVCIWVWWRGATASLRRVRWPLHVLRAGTGILMLFLFAYALRTLPLAEAYTLAFIAPLLITALSALVLGERIGAARWWAVAGGLVGVLIVLRPTGAGMLSLGAATVLGSAACYAVVAITVRVLARTDSSESIVFWFTAALAGGAGLLALPNWVALAGAHWPLLIALAITGFLGQILITEAFRRGEASAVAPFEYSALAWAAMLDWMLWQVLPDRYVLAGAVVIVASGVLLLRTEGARVRRDRAG